MDIPPCMHRCVASHSWCEVSIIVAMFRFNRGPCHSRCDNLQKKIDINAALDYDDGSVTWHTDQSTLIVDRDGSIEFGFELISLFLHLSSWQCRMGRLISEVFWLHQLNFDERHACIIQCEKQIYVPLTGCARKKSHLIQFRERNLIWKNRTYHSKYETYNLPNIIRFIIYQIDFQCHFSELRMIFGWMYKYQIIVLVHKSSHIG